MGEPPPAPPQSLGDSRLGSDDNIRSGAVDDCYQFGLLSGRDSEFIERLMKVVQKRFPLLRGYLQVSMRVRHRLAAVLLWAARSPADHLSHQVLESRRRHAVVGFVYKGIGIQPWIHHDSVNEVIYHGGNAVDAAKSVVERGAFS